MFTDFDEAAFYAATKGKYRSPWPRGEWRIADSLPWPTTATEGCERENRNVQKPELKPGMEGGTRKAARRICWLQGDVKRGRRHNKFKLHLILTSTITM